MASDGTAETLMAMWDKQGNAIRGEATVDIHAKTDWMADDLYDSKFFQIDGFSIKLSVVERSTEAATANAARAPRIGAHRAGSGAAGPAAPEPSASSGPFGRWLDGIAKPEDYLTDLDVISIERQLDLTSQRLLSACANHEEFGAVRIIKRKVAGAGRGPMTFFRLEIEDALITSVEWSDGDVPTENFDIVCRKLTVYYLDQTAGGEVRNPHIWAEWVPPAVKDK